MIHSHVPYKKAQLMEPAEGKPLIRQTTAGVQRFPPLFTPSVTAGISVYHNRALFPPPLLVQSHTDRIILLVDRTTHATFIKDKIMFVPRKGGTGGGLCHFHCRESIFPKGRKNMFHNCIRKYDRKSDLNEFTFLMFL